ncbi:sulfate permease [Mytilinidion resinicola]|uniref:Sulfate permease n=1 Tax=Mytilinidion resinicola TaxID=574789 RepID=A0A6A6YG70_9PEZI|nr:sulfate permease [Mytilinidion resinicola]KAF2807014.1 sulfate permease [Mytilinidion resinicola]
MAPTPFSRFLAKILFIDLDYRKEDPLVNSGADSVPFVETYFEREPTAREWLSRFLPTKAGSQRYIISLFPFWKWIFHYNLTWLLGDIIAGVTVGFVVIPQGMAYALLAKLPPEYGLYTSFVGFLLYWAFATSKDITIGTVAVMSTIVGNIVIKVQDQDPDIPAEQIARALSVIAGAVLLFIGLMRWGWIVEFIPLVAITSFMTGAAISIAAGQVPNLLGISGINAREATYKVIINTLKALPTTKLDAAMGLTALFLLYAIRIFCSWMTKLQPQRKKFWFFLSTLRMAFVILLYILISWLANRHVKGNAKKAKFKILGKVPRGFQHAGAPVITTHVLSLIAPDIPVTIIVLILEHIAISKSFGRINNYVINPSQELVAVGFTNILGPFLGAYPATGSFSRTAIKSKAGVRTPLAGLFTAAIVLLAIYALTSVFFYIPSSSLAGLIIHAVGDLITPPKVVYQFWETSPLEVVIFFAGVLLTIFTNIENGIYLTICASAALLLYRLAKTKGTFLGKVNIYPASADAVYRRDGGVSESQGPIGETTNIVREVYLPVTHQDGSNPQIAVQSPYPGIFVYRYSEGFTYINQAQYLDALTAHIQASARPTKLARHDKIGDRPWNDPGPRRGKPINLNDDRPFLRAVVLDFSSVNNVDTTSVQGLVDVRNQLDRYAAPEEVEWHFASITNRWTKRALTAAGFGYLSTDRSRNRAPWNPVYSFAAIGDTAVRSSDPKLRDEEHGGDEIQSAVPGVGRGEKSFPEKVTTVLGKNRPFFHIDVVAAVDSAIAAAESRLATTSSVSSAEKVAIQAELKA